MSKTIPRRNSFNQFLEPGDYSAAGKEPVLLIEEQSNVAQFQLIARHGKTAQLARSLSQFLNARNRLAPKHGACHRGLLICVTGPFEYWIMAEDTSDSQTTTSSKTVNDLLDIVGQTSSLFDQGAVRLVVGLTGRNATDVLAKGTSLDLHNQAFPVQGAAHTVIEHIPAIIARHTTPLCYDISFPRSYAASFSHWLCEAAQEFGYVILARQT